MRQYKKYNGMDCPNDHTKCIITTAWKSIVAFLDK
jgi:hypothetical protein